MSDGPEHTDVVVVGGGNAGFSAAQAAARRGRHVLLLEKGGPDEAGGNSYYTAGAFRVAHGGLDDIGDLVEHDDRRRETVLDPYPVETFRSDMERVTGGRAEPALVTALVEESRWALSWLRDLGLRFRLMYERQSYPDRSGRHVFWGGLAVGVVDGGHGLIAQHTAAAKAAGIEVRYGHRCEELLVEDGRVVGVTWRDESGTRGSVRADSVILAAGGFEADPELRREHLGEGWQWAKVRGTPLNTGDMLAAASKAGAAAGGDWSSCHSVAWDANAADSGDRLLTNRLTRQSYPLGIVVNAEGLRFVDEGADFRNYTYAKYGAAILRQPHGVAYQVFDATLRPQLRAEEYDSPGASVLVADSLEELAGKAGIALDNFVTTVTEFNADIDRDVDYDPAVKDGRAARGVTPPKSNWAMPLETGPYYAFPVTCGITFSFGGLRGDPHGRVLDESGEPIPGLFVCGEMLGGLFSGNYPGGSGLTSGTVFGRRAGSLA
ncbi:tricarballylate dehydrogenase [Saccharopolyspora lacisalsi]|uniref:Tricarballylate dehydrogenase n=1 Tax=Halosaccharopolyspora lacisalsi TaxID=1000566 RepID=A0A839E003_9PSEU|nr:FAD-dependent tricarballylate dehydrogenase TcuA [Halosaccharopolyspora lacisalsi]MBA8826430.1 tricarballylate dehydrogenase [Halosaccharopolyspora lacisalsi]